MKKFTAVLISVLGFGALGALILNSRSQSHEEDASKVQSAIAVSAISVTKQKLADDRSWVGTITPDNDVVVVSETMGRVLSISAEVGQYKAANSVLAKIDDELKIANFQAAEVNFQKAEKDLARFENLYKQKAATDMEVEGARLAVKAAEAQYVIARRQVEDTQIKTQISGIIVARYVNVGSMVQPGTPIANIVDISRLKVLAHVAERDAFQINVGSPVQVTTDIYPGTTFEGKVKSVGDKGNDAHAYPMEIVLPNSKEHPLKAGMFARVSLPAFSGREGIAIPREALVGSIRNPQVFVVENGMARLRDIVVGSESDSLIEVRSGLREAEILVISGHGNLKNGSAVAVVK